MNESRAGALIDQAEYEIARGNQVAGRQLLVLAGLEIDDGYWRRKYDSTNRALVIVSAYSAFVTVALAGFLAALSR